MGCHLWGLTELDTTEATTEQQQVLYEGFHDGSDCEESACNTGDPGRFLGWEDPLEEKMANHSGILSWRMPWTKEPGGLQSHGL